MDVVALNRLGSREEFAAFVRPCWADMARLARGLTGPGDWEDVLQEALASAWRKRGQFDAARGTARVWLLAVVADQARKQQRRTWRRREDPLEDQPVDEAQRHVGRDVDLHRALHKLTDRQRATVELHYYLGLPVAEVADVLGCSAGTVKSTLSDARARLRTELGEDDPDA